jgi:hypothetical protein
MRKAIEENTIIIIGFVAKAHQMLLARQQLITREMRQQFRRD